MNVEPQYVVKDYVISQATLNKDVFGILQNRRKISSGTVRNIMKQLEEGVHFESPIVVNKLDSAYRIVDGNHRDAAIRKFIKENPGSTVRVRLALYENLTEEEEKEVYTRWNKGRKQSTNDVVQQYEADIKIFAHLQNTDPTIDVYGTNGNLSFFRVVGAYFAAQDDVFHGGYIGSAFEFVEKAQRLGKKDADIIKAFLADFVGVFGQNGKGKNTWYKTTPFTAVFKIWYDNRANIMPDKMQSVLAKLASDGASRNWHSQGGASTCVNAHNAYLITVNTGRRKNHFV